MPQARDYRLVLTTVSPGKQVPVSLDEFASLLAQAANDGEYTSVSLPQQSVASDKQAVLPLQSDEIAAAMAERIAALERRIIDLAADKMPSDPLPRFLGGHASDNGHAASTIDTIERIIALENAVDAIERKLAEPAPTPEPHDIDHDADDGIPSFLRKEQDSRAAEMEQLRHDIANLHQQLFLIEEMLRRKPPEPQQPPVRDLARMDVISAGRRRRAAVVPESDVSCLVLLENVALLAQSGQEGPFTLMGVLAEANGMPADAWGDMAKRIIAQADTAKRVAVRTTAVETKALAEIAKAEDDDLVQRIARGAVEAIGAIEG